MEIFLDLVARERFHNHPGSVAFQATMHVFRSPLRIAHVMQAIEKRHEIIVSARIGFRHRHFEDDAIGNAGLLCALFRRFDGLVVIIETRKLRLRIVVCHQNG